MKKFIVLVAVVLLALPLYSQNFIGEIGVSWIFSKVQDFAGNLLIALGFAEVFARMVPTWKDESPLTGLISVLDRFVSNKAVSGGKFTNKTEESD